MSTFFNTDTKEMVTIEVRDRVTDTDCIDNMFQLAYDPNVASDDNGNWSANSEVVGFYQGLANEYQEAIDLMYKIRAEGTDEQRIMIDEIMERGLGYETNDWAGYIIQDIKDHNLA